MKTIIFPVLLLFLSGCANILRDENSLKPIASIHPALANGCACRQPEPEVVLQAPMQIFNIEAMYFEVDKSELLPVADQKLAEIVTSIHQLQPQTVLIEGHTDSTASLAYNQSLSVRRAETVKQHLIQRGINADSIQVVGYGETQPISNNSTFEGRQQNRRVEVTLQ